MSTYNKTYNKCALNIRGSGTNRYNQYPAGLEFLWNAKNSLGRMSAVGPDPTWSYAGTQYDADGNSIGAVPAVHEGKGVWCGPAYTNMLMNSKFEGAVSGTPGTAPTNWVALATGGTLSVSGEIIGISVTDNRHFYSQTVSLLASTTYRYELNINITSGSTTLYNYIAVQAVPSGTTIQHTLDGDDVAGSVVPSSGVHVIGVKIVVSTTAGTASIRLGIGTAGTTSGTVSAQISSPQVTSTYIYPYVGSGNGATASVVSAAGTGGGNGMSFALSSRMRECFERSLTDGVELFVSPTVGANWALSNGWYVHTPGNTASIYKAALVLGVRYLTTYEMQAGTAGSMRVSAGTVAGGGGGTIRTISGVYSEVLTCLGDVTCRFTPSVDFDGKIRLLSVQRLQPAVFTAAALCYMDASSAEVTTDTNIIAVNNTVTGGIYAASGGVLKAFDGTNTATVTVTGGWARGETLLICWWINPAGTGQQIGYKKSSESTITWGTEANYDGSVNPGTHLRLAYTSDKPLHESQTQLWSKSATDAEILRMMAYAA